MTYEKGEKMKTKIFLITALAMLLGVTAHAESIYVSPAAENGGDGSYSAPYSTLAEAKSRVRKLSRGQTEDIHVYLMDGTYNLTKALEFSPEDSGKNGYNVIYEAADGANAIISGGKQITDWELYDLSNNIWRANAEGIDSRQLYVNGVKAVRARTNSTGEIPSAASLKATDTGYSVPYYNFITGTERNTLDRIFNLSNISDVEFVYSCGALHQRMGVASVDKAEKTITMNSGFSKLADKTALTWIENAYELLDTPGEWYLNKSDGYVYYMPRSGENMANAEVIIPVLEYLIHGNGSDYGYNKGVSKTIDNLVFDGLTFMYTTWLGPDADDGYAAVQGGFGTDYLYDDDTYGLKQALRLDRSKNVTIRNCTFKELGCGAVRLGCGTKNSLITSNEIYNCAGGGIYVEERQRSWTDKAKTYLLENNTVSYNRVHDIATEYYSCIGIFLGFGKNFLITNNEVYNTPYTGISIGWGWNDNGSESLYKADVINENNRIYKNSVHDVMQKLGDGGGIYNLGSQPGMEIQNNVVCNVGANDGAAYYLDDGSRFINMQNNIGHDANIIVYAKGKYNNVKNNYFANYVRILPSSLDETVTVSDNTDVNDGSYPQDIIALAGIPNEIIVEIRGKTTPNKTVCYGLFNKYGINTSEDIFYINETFSDGDGNYAVTVKLNMELSKNAVANVSETDFNADYLTDSEGGIYDFKPQEFYDIYDARAEKSASTANITSVFSARNSSFDGVTLIAVAYDENNRLIDAKFENYSYPVTQAKTFSIDCGDYTGTVNIKIMMWNSVYGLRSLTEFKPLSI